MSSWDVFSMPDLTGRRFVVTGANGGLGAVVTRALAMHNASVVMACRNEATGQRVADELGDRVEVARLDLADQSSIREFADGVGEFDVLINNAGLMYVPFSRTVDGFETQFGVNHLGHFALTGLLLDKIADRVVTVSSIAHAHTPKLWIDDLNYERRRYQRFLAYAQSKLSNLMFARELDRRLQSSDRKVRSFAVHPGVSGTDLFARTETIADRFTKLGAATIGHSPEAAAESTLFAATESDADPTVFWGPTRWVIQSRGPVGAARTSRLSRNTDLWGRLWDHSESMTGVSYAV
ncbi:putative oxidoreductase [Gordonia araii NBRC 100433]|uniref:Putative oxidoreductase n=1 Tax=Gordonia araii NBRC 100433 TaxID=1073574 RepID=G7H1C0_9ACTN|nr:oxidoreductase [Gordonia araii]NNG97595.1 SDR family NAD(P)-dependent oxidoreductase [Gordonia araii NBRC 100433]GAB09645.1 putative oxidoreductase [Gordonia araii NBRC 100433]